MAKSRQLVSSVAFLFGLVAATPAMAVVIDATVRATDVVFLAGRTDVVIPPASDNAWSVIIRHSGGTPEEALETFPSAIAVTGGDVIRVADPAVGGINFFNGFGPPYFGPGGNGAAGSSLNPLGGISGYSGPQGPLVGVFLDGSVPSGGPPPITLDFTPAGLGLDFLNLSPLLRQIFYIGDGVTSTGVFQQFVAPAGATRLFLGIPDGFGFGGPPGAYDDNDGSYRVRIGINDLPTAQIPEPGTLGLLGFGFLATMLAYRRKA